MLRHTGSPYLTYATICIQCGISGRKGDVLENLPRHSLIICNPCNTLLQEKVKEKELQIQKEKELQIQKTLESSQKICVGCNISRPMYHYNKNKNSADGYTHFCKKCISDKKERKKNESKSIKINIA